MELELNAPSQGRRKGPETEFGAGCLGGFVLGHRRKMVARRLSDDLEIYSLLGVICESLFTGFKIGFHLERFIPLPVKKDINETKLRAPVSEECKIFP